MVRFLDTLASEWSGRLLVGLTFILVMGLVFLQIVSFLLTKTFGITMLTLGPLFALVTIAAVLLIAMVAALSPLSFTRESWAALVVITGVMFFMFFLFPKLMPEFFDQQSILDLKANTMSIFGSEAATEIAPGISYGNVFWIALGIAGLFLLIRYKKHKTIIPKNIF